MAVPGTEKGDKKEKEMKKTGIILMILRGK